MADSSRPWFCVVDPELKDTNPTGHYLVYDRTVCEAAERLGYNSMILGRKTIDGAKIGDTPIIPTFTYGIWEADPADYRYGEPCGLRAGYRFFRELRSALSRFDLHADSFVFVQSVYRLQIFGWALFSVWSWLVRGPKVAILLRYQHEFYDDDASALGFRILEWFVWAGKVRFLTDSERLADDFSVLTKAPFDVVPIPHADIPEPAEAPILASGRLRFGTLGGARDEKGVSEIINAIELLARHGLASDIQFVLHIHNAWPENIFEKLEKLKEQTPENVSLIEHALSDEDYGKLLHSLDVVLLPYWRSVYRSRTSGPLTEAISAGKAVIVTRDTWLEDEMEARGAGVVCADRSPIDLARAILEAAHRFEELNRAARARQSDAAEHHNAEQLVLKTIDLFRVEKSQIDREASVVIAPWPLLPASLRSGMGTRIQCLIQFLAWRSRIVCVASPLGKPFEGPRNMIVRPLGGRPWHDVEKYAALVHRLGKIAQNGDNMWSAMLLVWHLNGLFDRDLKRGLKKIIFRFDRVFLEYTFLAFPTLGIARRKGASTALTNYDVISNQIRTPWLRSLVAWLERHAMKRADHAVAVAKNDSDFFASRGVVNTLVPNCVDPRRLKYFFPLEPEALLRDLFDIDLAGRRVVLFLGAEHPPNAVAAAAIKRMASAFDENDPAAPLFVVAGSCLAPARAGNFLAVGSIDELALSALYEAAALILIPLLDGTGMSLKTVEAMALGKAILGTQVGFRGIEIKAGIEAEVEDDLAAYPRLIARLLAEPSRRESLGRNARRASEPFFFWNAMKPYGLLLDMPSNFPEFDPTRDRELEARALTHGVEQARRSGRVAVAEQLESWWLGNVSTLSDTIDHRMEKSGT